MKRRSLTIGVLSVLLLMALTACGGDSTNTDSNGIMHVEDGAADTQVAQTVAALQPTATPEPEITATPIPTLEPYMLPALSEEVDPDTVIARVGNDDLTLDEYRKMVRFERFVVLYQLAETVERQGIEEVLDLTNPNNNWVASVFVTLADSYSFGGQVQRIMTIDSIVLQEATRRELEVNPVQFDARVAQYLLLQVGDGGALPPEFDEEYARFLTALETYTGMNEEEFRRVVRARVLYSQLRFIIGQSPEAIPATGVATVGVEIEDMLVKDQQDAFNVAARLSQGDTLQEIMLSMGYQQTSDQTSRVLRYSSTELPKEVMTMISQANAGEVVGPFQFTEGWYVGRVVRQVADTLSPEDVDLMRENYFQEWVESKMDDPEYVLDYDNWVEHTPQDPLPMDVSPLLRTENVIVPEDTGDGLDPFGLGLQDEVPPTEDASGEDSAADDTAQDTLDDAPTDDSATESSDE